MRRTSHKDNPYKIVSYRGYFAMKKAIDKLPVVWYNIFIQQDNKR